MRLALLIAASALLAVACGGGDTKLKCTSNDDCHSGSGGITYVCDTVTQVCMRECASATASDDCLGGQYCDTAANVCRDDSSGGGGDPVAGDPAAGDPAAGD